jgi:hypothetical protein
MGALIWLASYPKSGNTWMRSFLHNLFLNTQEPSDINDLDRFCVGESGLAPYLQFMDKPPAEMELAELVKLRPLVQREFMKASPDSVFVKTHNYLGDWEGAPLHNMDVTAGAIYILRNPLDVVLSLANHFGLTIDDAITRLGEIGTGTSLTESHMPELHSSWSVHVRSWTQHDGNAQLLVLRYEDMLHKPEQAFGRVTQFLGLPVPLERLQRAIRNSSFKELKAQEESRGFREASKKASSFFREGRAEQWRDKLSPEQVRRVIGDHKREMQRFGYIPKDYA